MGADEEGTLAQLKAFRKTLVDPTIAKHRGRIVKTTGDGLLVEFASGLDDAAAMFGDCGVDKRFSESLQLRQRAFLVGTNQAAITGDIRRQDSRQSPLYGLAAQDTPRLRKLDVHHSSIVGRCPARDQCPSWANNRHCLVG